MSRELNNSKKTKDEILVDIYAKYQYSESNSLKVFKKFLNQTEYSEATKKEIYNYAKKIHIKYPSIGWLQNEISRSGIRKIGKIISPSSGKGSPYLDFLAIIGVVEIKFEDFFNTNPTTIKKLVGWYSKYFEVIGANELFENIKIVVESTKNRELNKEKSLAIAERTIVYLFIKYQITHVKDITLEIWSDFIAACRENSKSKKYCTHTKISVIEIALYNMGIFQKILQVNRKKGSIEKVRAWEEMKNIKKVVNLYFKIREVSLKKSTIQHYNLALEKFFVFLSKKYSKDMKFDDIQRKDIVEYITYLHSEVNNGEFGLSCLEGLMLGLKTFLRFLSENLEVFKNEGLETIKKKVFINDDFKVKKPVGLPKGIEREVLDALLATLKFETNRLYKYAFLLMLITGISKIDLMNLKVDCLVFDKVKDVYYIEFYRVKVKKMLKIKIQKQAVELIENLVKLNTQQRLQKHPDGTNCIFLFNDGCKKVNESWLTLHIKLHREKTIEKYPQLREKIEKVTAHRLRHTFACLMRDKGADILTIKYLLGHSSINTTKRYVAEQDKRKVALVDSLKSKEFACSSLESSNMTFIESEEGLKFLDSMLKIENNLLIGKCTINGYKKCPMAYKCLDCIYLCSTKEDLPEMIDMLKILRKEYGEIKDAIDTIEKNEVKKNLIKNKGQVERRIELLCKKINKINNKEINNESLQEVSTVDTGIISFVEE